MGLAPADVPNRPDVPRALFQIPSAQTPPLGVMAIDADRGTRTLACADQTCQLRPGASWSYKQKTAGERAAIEGTTRSNHGRLASIGLSAVDAGSR